MRPLHLILLCACAWICIGLDAHAAIEVANPKFEFDDVRLTSVLQYVTDDSGKVVACSALVLCEQSEERWLDDRGISVPRVAALSPELSEVHGKDGAGFVISSRLIVFYDYHTGTFSILGDGFSADLLLAEGSALEDRVRALWEKRKPNKPVQINAGYAPRKSGAATAIAHSLRRV